MICIIIGRCYLFLVHQGTTKQVKGELPVKRGEKRDANVSELLLSASFIVGLCVQYLIFGSQGNIIEQSWMCHQCQRNDKGRVVRCLKCRAKRFCIPCLENWY